MAFSFTTDVPNGVVGNAGNMKFAHGTFTNTAGSTGGVITLPFKTVTYANVSYTSAQAAADASITKGTAQVTILTDADLDGLWEAWGYDG